MNNEVVGITGTREGITEVQEKVLRKYLKNVNILLHGDCIGADADAHRVAVSLGIAVTIYPPLRDSARAFCKSNDIQPPDTYLARNRKIVEECEVLIALPKQDKEIWSGGTWYTVRYARGIKRSIVIIFPDGRVLEENDKFI